MSIKKLLLVCGLLFSCGLNAQLFRSIYVYEAIPAFDKEVLAQLEKYRITFVKGSVQDLYTNYATYGQLDSLYGKKWMKQLNGALHKNKDWSAFYQKTMLPLHIENGNEKLSYAFYAPGLIHTFARTRCNKNLPGSNCATVRFKYSRRGKVDKKI
jgi:hypothetical protein